MSFTNTADPLFMTGAVAVGMFGRPDITAVVLAAHYLSSVTVGIIMRFHGRKDRGTPAAVIEGRGSVPGRAWNAMGAARARDGRPFGKLLGDAVRNSVNTLLMIGGFIIVFSVFVQTLEVIGAATHISSMIAGLLTTLGVDPAVSGSLVRGIFEITIGTEAASQASTGLLPRVAAASAVIAWSGLSVHAQVASLIQGTGMRLGPFVLARVLHACLAGLYTFVLWEPIRSAFGGWALPVFWQQTPAGAGAVIWLHRVTLYTSVTAGLLLVTGIFFSFLVVLRGVAYVFISHPGDRRSGCPGGKAGH